MYDHIYQVLCFNRESLTAIVYFFKVREIFSMPIMDEKYNYIQYINLDKLTDVNGNQYRLYNGTKQYRYKHAYNLLIDGQVDPTDRSQFTAALKQAWLDYNGVWSMRKVYRVKKIIRIDTYELIIMHFYMYHPSFLYLFCQCNCTICKHYKHYHRFVIALNFVLLHFSIHN